jgi:hypothetical protein
MVIVAVGDVNEEKIQQDDNETMFYRILNLHALHGDQRRTDTILDGESSCTATIYKTRKDIQAHAQCAARNMLTKSSYTEEPRRKS